MLAATFTNGPNELIDFVLPLWGGAAIGLSATEVGILIAVELAVSVIIRPVAGVLADAIERTRVAATGALLYAVSAAGFALATSAALAYPAAAVGGAGGALLWVSIRAIISERLAEDSSVFPRLLTAQETGSWVAFIAGMALIGIIGFAGLFAACAVASVVAAALLLLSPQRPVPYRGHGTREGTAAAGLGAVARKLRPMLLAVAVTMAAESALSLLLLLHLQREFDLSPAGVAYVFLPGAIAMSVAAEQLHRYVVRFGRTRVLQAASLGSAAFAANLAWAPNPYVIAALWILSGLAWAAVIPIQQAVIAEASGDRAGRGMGVYESASLLGALAGALVAGILYDGTSWPAACLAAAAVILSGAVVIPRAMRILDVAELPPPPPTAEKLSETGVEPRNREAPETPGSAKQPDPGPELATTRRQIATELAEHAAVFAGAQLLLALAGLSWIRDLLTGDDTVERLINGEGQDTAITGLIYGAGKIWVLVIVVHALWTGARLIAMALRRSSR